MVGISGYDQSNKYTDHEEDYDLSKVQYLFSFTYMAPLSDRHLDFALSYGSKGSVDPYYNLEISALSYPFSSRMTMLYNLYNEQDNFKWPNYQPNVDWNETDNYNLSGSSISAGATYRQSGTAEAVAKIKFINGINDNVSVNGGYTYSPTGENLYSYDNSRLMVQNGSGIQGVFEGRYYLGPFILGARVDCFNFSYAFNPYWTSEQLNSSASMLDTAGGVDICLEKFNFPVEVLYQTASLNEDGTAAKYDWSYSIYGFRLGAEYNLTSNFALRAGGVYKSGSRRYSRIITLDQNLDINMSEIFLGAGFTEDNFEFNITIGYYYEQDDGMVQTVSNYSSNEIAVVPDMRYLF